HQLSAIEQLPEELVHKVIDFTPETIISLKLVCKSLRVVVDNYVRQSRAIPIVQLMEIHHLGFDYALLSISIEIFIDTTDLFESRLKHHLGRKFAVTRITRDIRKQPKRYYVDFKPSEDMIVLVQLNTCFGGMHNGMSSLGSIGEVQLHVCKQSVRTHIQCLLKGINIDNLLVTGNIYEHDVDFILNLISTHKVDGLTLKVVKTIVPDPVEVLHILSSRVRTLNLHQMRIGEDERAMFGMQEADWARIILGMFTPERKLDTLKIVNHVNTVWIQADAEAELRRSLPGLVKKVWFEGIRHQFLEEIEYIDRDYSVQVSHTKLSIKHTSRAIEPFTPSTTRITFVQL
ncbi:hypothetical protein PMAYCL1PPCAC_20526, partial [Pristionchus mayeri]